MKRIAALLLACGLALSASATTLKRYTLLEVRDAAEAIFIGEPVSMSSRVVAKGKLIATDYVINVKEVLSGNVGATTTVTFLGGRVGERAMTITGSPTLERGQTYVFFRTKQPNNTTVGWGQGLFRIENARVGNATRPVLITDEGVSLVVENGKLALGSNVELVGGEMRKVADAHVHEAPQQGIATNADGTPARRARNAQTAPASAPAETPATLDDLRAFVRAGIRK